MTRRSDELTAAFINTAAATLNAEISRLNAGKHPEEAYARVMAQHLNTLDKIMVTWA